jgi:hypothetical protein
MREVTISILIKCEFRLQKLFIKKLRDEMWQIRAAKPGEKLLNRRA